MQSCAIVEVVELHAEHDLLGHERGDELAHLPGHPHEEQV